MNNDPYNHFLYPEWLLYYLEMHKEIFTEPVSSKDNLHTQDKILSNILNHAKEFISR